MAWHIVHCEQDPLTDGDDDNDDHDDHDDHGQVWWSPPCCEEGHWTTICSQDNPSQVDFASLDIWLDISAVAIPLIPSCPVDN